MSLKLNGPLAALFAAGLSLSAAEILNDPYGVCAHVSRAELAVAPQEFDRLREADIRWVRTDFDWSGIEKRQGDWNYAHLDKLTALAAGSGINLLPILDYDVPWATPAWKNPDVWGAYVRRTVSRYAKQLRYWEVWNEQNHERFWRDTPNGKNYVPLLKRAYEEIKAIDPALTVLYGGTAGVPLSYIEDSLAAGAGNCFDVMNIHPYHWQGTPELLIRDLKDLKALMKKYRIDKPIWITEVGWSTARSSAFYRQVLPAVFRRAGIDPAQVTAAVIEESAGMSNFNPEFNLPGFKAIDRIGFDQLEHLDAGQYPVLVPAVGEEFPARYIPALVEYVKHGGTLLLPSGLPFYYALQPDGEGGTRKVRVNAKYLSRFHIGWDAWWTKQGVPKKETYQKPAPEFAGKFEAGFNPAGRFLHDRNLKGNDRFIPVIEAGAGSYKGAVAALYKLDSDLKGNIIVCTATSAFETVPEERQAELLPRTYLIALANGVERVFWYNFRSGEWSPDAREAHFGIVRRNLEAKPAFTAYRTLTKLCPSGSTVPELTRSNGVYTASWRRPDGVRVHALWTAHQPQPVKLEIDGQNVKALNHLGEEQPLPGGTFTARPAPLYLEGAESMTVQGL